MLSLFVDSSKSYLSLVSAAESEIIFSYTNMFVKSMHEKILETLNFLLIANNLMLSEIDEFYVVVGPGSYTGIRIGIATMLGISTALMKPLFGMTILDAIAMSVGEPHPVIAYRLLGDNYVIRRYDFVNNIYSDFENVNVKDIPEESLLFSDNYYNISKVISNPKFRFFLNDYKPFYMQPSFLINENINIRI
jgi:tRNA threonylcarbamoyl adenosine modification protein YeaZ